VKVRWSNFGVSFTPRWLNMGFCIRTPIGNFIVRQRDRLLFSERYGMTPYLTVGSHIVKWVWLR
jgi:hypothetical protein